MENLLLKLRKAYPDHYGEIKKAYAFAAEAHKGQKRSSGEDYIIHPCAVVEILADFGFDSSTVIAAFLHDVLEDTSVTADELKELFGEEIVALVEGVTKLDKLQFNSREDAQAENFRKLFMALAKDLRYEGNKAYLSINETLYSIDDLDTVADSNYLVASRLAESFVNELNKLPKVEQVAQSDMKDIAAIMLVYENMTEYQRNFLGDETKALYTKYAQKHQALAVEPVKEFIQDMKEFADSDEIVITEENAVAAEGLVERYNRLSSYQQSLFASDSEELYNTIAKKYEEYIKSKEQ